MSRQKKKLGIPSNSERLLVLQSYVLKPDFINIIYPQKAHPNYQNNDFKLPKVKVMSNFKNNKEIVKKAFFSEELANYRKRNRNENVKESFNDLRKNIRNPDEYLYTQNFHKEKFLIRKEDEKNISNMRNVLKKFINKNKIYQNDESTFRSQDCERSSPFDINQLQFAEKLDEHKSLMRKKYGWREKNIKKNKLLLEHILLQRLELKENSNVYKINNQNEDN